MANGLVSPLKVFKTTFRALRYRNYRLMFIGQSISLVGTWMQQLAVSWFTYRITHSTVLLGVVGFASLIPSFLLAPFTGALIDRWNQHRILITTQILSMIQAVILALLVLTEMITIWQIILLSAFLGFVNSLDNPTRQSFIIDLVENKEDLTNAIALNASMFNAARLIGPSIAGILIALVGEGVCFLVNALSFVPVIISLLLMRVAAKERKTVNAPLWHSMKEGIAYAYGFEPIRYVLLLLAWSSLLGIFYPTLMPVFAQDILHGGAHTFGFLIAASGCGALTGTMYLASRRSILGMEKVLITTSLIFGIGLIIFSLSRVFWLSVALMVFVGFGMISQFSCSNTILQSMVEEDKRGRVMSFFIMASLGMMPFGSLLAGSLARLIGTPQTMMLSGALCTASAVMFMLKVPDLVRQIRPVYVKKGFITGEETGT